jgi:Rps23 Pro-64 3,4-dihydroxylase Tpa1-like proline 4-hydroxylase
MFPQVLPKETLERLVAKADDYQHAKPFSHIIIDDFLPPEVLEKVLEEFPGVQDPQWTEFKLETENSKLASNAYELIPPYIRYVLDQLNTPPFLQALERLTGISHLVPDPYYMGGGMHQTKRGGWLDIHVDFNYYERLKLYRRINVLLYLNKEWKEEYNGSLEIWDDKVKNMHNKILPLFNRCVIFTTSENSHHGHPDPITCPEGVTRKSLAWYYYTAENGENISDEAHTTLFKHRPGEGELFTVKNLKKALRYCTPPILIDFSRKIRGIK